MDKWLVHSRNRKLYSSEAEQTTSTNNCGWNSQTWSWLGEAGHKCAHWKPGMSERIKTIQAQWLCGVRDKVQSLVGAGGKWWRGAWGVFREAKFPFLDLNASYMGVLEHSCSCTLLTGVQFCVSYLNKKLKHNLDTAAFKALPGSLWQMPTALSPFSYYFERPHDGQMALSHTFPDGALLGSYYWWSGHRTLFNPISRCSEDADTQKGYKNMYIDNTFLK